VRAGEEGEGRHERIEDSGLRIERFQFNAWPVADPLQASFKNTGGRRALLNAILNPESSILC
jgi:hypothetical protein